MSSALVKQQLRTLLSDIEYQIEAIKTEAERRNILTISMQNMDGSFTLVPLLAAKAQVLAALAYLER